MLNTDKFFYDALRSDGHIREATQDRIFNTARPTIDEREDRVPYIVIRFDSLTNDQETKDDGVESLTDIVNISILVVAKDREKLASLTQAVRDRCKAYYEQRGGAYHIVDWRFGAGAILYDELKPCIYQNLTYEIETDLY